MPEARVPFPASLEERYKNPRFIGSGGASTVYAAHDSNLNKLVAIKILGPRTSGQKYLRFQQEAKVIAKLTHPNIVTALDFGLVDEKFAYMVMDLVGEESLLSLVEKRKNLSLQKSIHIFKQVCTAMAHAHSQGVLHRDLKPGNVLLDDPESNTPQAKVADFGVAKIAGTPFLVTTGNIFIGTPNYMSPEQFRAEEVDQRSDIYSFGCLMFETLTGTPPFPGDLSADLALKHATGAIPQIKDTISGEQAPQSLQEIVNKCLAKQPDDRYESFSVIEELLNALLPEPLVQRSTLRRQEESLGPKEPYLVSAGNVDYRISDSVASGKIISGIIVLVLVIGVGICIGLVGPGFHWLLPDAKDGSGSTSSQGKNLTDNQDETPKPVDFGPKSWQQRQPHLPKSMLAGPTDSLLAKAEQQIRRHRESIALEFLDAVLEREPRNLKALVMRSDARRARKDDNGALTDITSAIVVAPNNLELVFKRAMLRRKTGDLNSALDDFNFLIEKNPRDANYYCQRANVYSEMDRTDDAMKDFIKSIELKPNAEAHKGKALLEQIGADHP